MVRDWQKYLDAQGRLNRALQQRQTEWQAFAEDPSLPVPQEENYDALHEASAEALEAIDERLPAETTGNQGRVAPEVTNSWFGQGPRYNSRERYTQTGRFEGGRPTTYVPDSTRNEAVGEADTSCQAQSSSAMTLANADSENRARMRMRDLLSSTVAPNSSLTQGEGQSAGAAQPAVPTVQQTTSINQPAIAANQPSASATLKKTSKCSRCPIENKRTCEIVANDAAGRCGNCVIAKVECSKTGN